MTSTSPDAPPAREAAALHKAVGPPNCPLWSSGPDHTIHQVATLNRDAGRVILEFRLRPKTRTGVAQSWVWIGGITWPRSRSPTWSSWLPWHSITIRGPTVTVCWRAKPRWLAFLLFLAGLDVELERLRGRPLRLAGLGFVLSLGLALSLGYTLDAAGQVRSPLFVGIVLSATALGLVAPILKDAGESEGEFGQIVLAAATIADFGTVILLSLLFSRNAGNVGSRLALLGSFVALVAATAFGLARAERSKMLSGALGRLGDTTAQIRVRGAVLLLIGFVGLAERFGLETIQGLRRNRASPPLR